MQEPLPSKVADAFSNLKVQYDFHIVLLRHDEHFYVYRAATVWDKKTKKARSIREYLGRITKDGAFLRKTASQKEIEFEKAKAIVEANGGMVTFPEKPVQQINQETQEIDEIDKKILTYLSMNARAHVPAIAKNVELSISATQYRIKRLEENFKIKYILEIDTAKLGYIPFIILIKFRNSMPNEEQLRSALSNEPQIQFAAITHGRYDLLLYVLFENNEEASDKTWKLQYDTIFKKYDSYWYLFPSGYSYSFVPTTNTFIEKILKDKVVNNRKRDKHFRPFSIKKREVAILSELNKNSVIDFSDIDNVHNFSKGTSRYVYADLIEKGIISRSTINMNPPNLKYIGMILLKSINGEKLRASQFNLWFDAINKPSIIDNHALIVNIGLSSGSIRFMPIFRNEDLEKEKDTLAEHVDGCKLETLTISATLVGNLCLRRFDSAYSKAYARLVQMGKLKQTTLMHY